MSVQNVVSVILAVFTAMLVLTSCTENTGTNNEYMQITQKEAKNIMDTQAGYMILDVRTEEEFAEGHISG